MFTYLLQVLLSPCSLCHGLHCAILFKEGNLLILDHKLSIYSVQWMISLMQANFSFLDWAINSLMLCLYECVLALMALQHKSDPEVKASPPPPFDLLLWSCLLSVKMTLVAPSVSKFSMSLLCLPWEKWRAFMFLHLPEKFSIRDKIPGEISCESEWAPTQEREGWRMTYEERGGQEKLLPSSLHHDHLGAAAPRAVAIFLALIGGEMPPQGPQGSFGSREGAAQPFFLIHPEPHWQGHPVPTSGPAGLQRSENTQCAKDSAEAELDGGPWIIDTYFFGPLESSNTLEQLFVSAEKTFKPTQVLFDLISILI